MSEVVVNVLHEDGTPKTPEEVNFEREQITANGDTPIVPGSQTDSALLLTKLQDERKKRRDLEDEIQTLKGAPPAPASTQPAPTDLATLSAEIETLKKDGVRKDLFLEFPLLKERSADFDKYVSDPENAGMSLKTATKAFMVENGLGAPRRPGLEKPTGGDRVPPSTGMTVDDIRILRETNYKKYIDMLQKGLIKI